MELSLAFIVFVLVSAFTPGPNNIMIMASGLNYGVARSLPHLMGITLGVPSMFLVVGLVLAWPLQNIPWLRPAVQLLGIVYLFYLAWLVASADSNLSQADAENTSKPLTFFQAALFQWVNPKAWMLGAGALGVFVDSDTSLVSQIVIMSIVFSLSALPSAGTWMLFGSALASLFNNPARRKWFNYSMGILLIASVMPAVLDLVAQYSSH